MVFLLTFGEWLRLDRGNLGHSPIFWSKMEDLHVVPINDLKPHLDSSTCPCKPRLFIEFGKIWIHNSWDGREITERAIDNASTCRS